MTKAEQDLKQFLYAVILLGDLSLSVQIKITRELESATA